MIASSEGVPAGSRAASDMKSRSPLTASATAARLVKMMRTARVAPTLDPSASDPCDGGGSFAIHVRHETKELCVVSRRSLKQGSEMSHEDGDRDEDLAVAKSVCAVGHEDLRLA